MLVARVAAQGSPALAGVRTNFYRRTRPTGDPIYDVEWSLAKGERVALPIVRNLAQRWPLAPEDKSTVGQFFALQHVRGPAFRRWHEAYVAEQSDMLRRDPKAHATPPEGMTHEEAIERYIEHLTSATFRAERMFKLVRAVGTMLGSMHWTLVEFSKPVVATSDHPVVVWPLGRHRGRPEANDLNSGVVDTLELFVPLGPTSLLLMTWLDDENPPYRCKGCGTSCSDRKCIRPSER